MGSRSVRGASAFRPSDQTFGAVANSKLTAPSGSGSTVTVQAQAATAKLGGMGPPGPTIPANDAPVNDTGSLVDKPPPESSDDESMPPSTPVRPPAASGPSMIFSAISKRKRSAFDDDEAPGSVSASSFSTGSKRTRTSASSGASALHGIKDMMAGISSSMRNGPLGQPRQHRRSSAERRIEATALLQEKEDLTVDQIVAFADLFEQTTSKADTYMALIRDDVRKVWVQNQLAELGFPKVGGSEA
jgi:hypothetical protein